MSLCYLVLFSSRRPLAGKEGPGPSLRLRIHHNTGLDLGGGRLVEIKEWKDPTIKICDLCLAIFMLLCVDSFNQGTLSVNELQGNRH